MSQHDKLMSRRAEMVECLSLVQAYAGTEVHAAFCRLIEARLAVIRDELVQAVTIERVAPLQGAAKQLLAMHDAITSNQPTSGMSI